MGQVRHIKGTKNKLSSSFLKEDDIAHAVDRGELVLTDVDGTKTFLSNNGYYGDTSSTGAAGAFSVTIEGIKELYQGLKVTLHLKKATSAAGNTLNINGLGNTPIFKHLAEPLTDILPAGGIMQLVYSDTAAGFIITSPINDKKYIPYTGADKAINLNSQEVIHAGKKRLDIGSFTFKDLSTSATGGINRYIEYEDIATLQEPIATGLRLIRVEIPITTNTQWNMVIDLLGNIHTNANQSNTTLKIQGYGVSNTHTYVNTDNPNYIKGVRFGRNSAGTKTVVIIETSTIYNHPRIILRTVGFTIALPDTMFSLTKSDFGLSTVLEADITDTIQATILNKDFVRDSFYMGYIPYAGATKAIDINNQNFSHNGKLISGTEKLDIKAYAGTKKYIQPKGGYYNVASFAGILQVRLSIRNRVFFDCKVNITDSTTTAGLGGHSTLYLTGFSYNGTSLTMCRVTTDNPNNFLKVDFGLNAAADVVINIYSADGKFYYPSAEIEWVRTGFQEDTRLENISNYGLDFLTVAAATTDFNVAQTVLKADFVKGADFSNYYSKTDADDRFAKNGNVYSKTEANDLFVGVNSVQTIVGLKTFNQIPLAPTIEPSLPNHLVRKDYVDQFKTAIIGGMFRFKGVVSTTDPKDKGYPYTPNGNVNSAIYEQGWMQADNIPATNEINYKLMTTARTWSSYTKNTKTIGDVWYLEKFGIYRMWDGFNFVYFGGRLLQAIYTPKLETDDYENTPVSAKLFNTMYSFITEQNSVIELLQKDIIDLAERVRIIENT